MGDQSDIGIFTKKEDCELRRRATVPKPLAIGLEHRLYIYKTTRLFPTPSERGAGVDSWISVDLGLPSVYCYCTEDSPSWGCFLYHLGTGTSGSVLDGFWGY